jgi:hypothetical protein
MTMQRTKTFGARGSLVRVFWRRVLMPFKEPCRVTVKSFSRPLVNKEVNKSWPKG